MNGSGSAVRDRLVQLRGWSHGDGVLLGSALAAIGGLLAAGRSGEVLDSWIEPALLLLLATLGWGNLWWFSAGTDWASLRQRWQERPGRGPAAGTVPYGCVTGPAARLGRWWADLTEWAATDLWPQRGGALEALIVAVLLSVGLGAALGFRVLLLSLLAMSVSQAALFLGKADGQGNALAQALVEIGCPWLGARLLGANLDGAALVSAAGLALAYAGFLRAGRGQGGLGATLSGYALLVLTLAGRGSVLGMALTGMLLWAQLAVQVWLGGRPDSEAGESGLAPADYLRLAQWPLMTALLVVAVAR